MTSSSWAAAITVAAITAVGCGGDGDDAVADDGVGDDADDAPGDDAGPGPHPFGGHGPYDVDGVIAPTGDPADLDAATAAFYDAWKQRYVVDGCAPGEKRIKSSPATDAFTVSEAHGYGMLIAVIMEGHDPGARELFDGLYMYYVAHPSQNDGGLMAWAQNAACDDIDGADSATDGDLDIAYALLLADRQWGSNGSYDYAAAAARIIEAIERSELHPSGSILIGDWASSEDEHYTGTRLSDFALSSFRAYGAGSAAVVERGYAIVAHLQDSYAPATGLVPDFAIDADTAAPSPAPAGWLEGADDGRYGYNACRVPWRLATDYLMSAEPRARDAVRRINTWIRSATGDDPAAVRDGYRLDGTATGSSAVLAFVAPLAVGAMVEPDTGTNQPWLDALWTELVDRPLEDYYGDSLKLLAMIVVSGNWWLP